MNDNNEIKYIVGKNAIDNWKIYREAKQIDTIFHLEKFTSPYVIVNFPMNELTKEHIYMAANLCKDNSKYKNVPKLGILYTSISNTKLGNKVGSFVIINRHKIKTIMI